MSRNIVIVVAVMVSLLTVPYLVQAQSEMAQNDSLEAMTKLQGDVEQIKNSSKRIEQELQNLQDSNFKIQENLDQLERSGQELENSLREAEQNLGQQIKDSSGQVKEELIKTNIKLNQLEKSGQETKTDLRRVKQSLEKQIEKSGQKLEDSLQEVKQDLSQRVKESSAETQKRLGQISGKIKIILYLIIAIIIISVLVYVIVLFNKRRDKYVWIVVDKVEVDGEEKTYKVLVRFSSRQGIYTSPLITRGGGGIERNTPDALTGHLRNALKKALSKDTKSEFTEQVETLMQGGKIKEIS